MNQRIKPFNSLETYLTITWVGKSIKQGRMRKFKKITDAEIEVEEGDLFTSSSPYISLRLEDGTYLAIGHDEEVEIE